MEKKGSDELSLLKMRNEMEARLHIYNLTDEEKKSLGELAQMKGLIVDESVDSIEKGEQKVFVD